MNHLGTILSCICKIELSGGAGRVELLFLSGLIC
jgi:hypothetical protein